MNLILVEPGELKEDGTACLDGRRAHHLLEVLKVRPGQQLRAGVLGQGRARAEVLSTISSRVVIRLTAGGEETQNATAFRLILALPRPKAIKRVVQNAACMGVTDLELVNAWRVSSSYFSSPVLDPSRLRHEAILGAEQGGRFRIPDIRVHRLLMPFLDSLGTDDEDLRLLAHPSADRSLADVDAKRLVTDLTLAIGPEGGWIDREIESLRQRDFLPFRIGDWILRSEIAITAAIAQIDLLRKSTRPGDSA